MKTTLNHFQFNVAAANLPFYKELFGFLGWNALYEDARMAGYGTGQGANAWFHGKANGTANDYDGRGLNHFAFGAESQADVDSAAEWLQGKGVTALFETPRHRPEFVTPAFLGKYRGRRPSESETYYHLMFESPDRMLFEVVYMGPKS